MTERLDHIFAALADRTRRAILAMLLEDDLAVTDVAAPLPMSLAAVSKHLIVLERAGLIRRERRGRIVWCRLEPAALRGAATWMQGFGQFDPVDLDGLERFLLSEALDTGQQDRPRAVREAAQDGRLAGSHDERHDDDDDHDDADDVDDTVHEASSRLWHSD